MIEAKEGSLDLGNVHKGIKVSFEKARCRSLHPPQSIELIHYIELLDLIVSSAPLTPN